MGFFENTLGGLGRWMDSVVERLRDRLHGYSRPSPRRSIGEWVSDQNSRVAEKVEEARHQWSLAPDDQRRRWTITLIVLCSVLIGGGTGYAVFRLNGGHAALSGADAAAVRALQDRMKEAETAGAASQLFPGAK